MRRSVPGSPAKLTLKNPHLVAEHHELDVPVGVCFTDGPDETKEAAESEIHEGEDHGGSWLIIDGKRQLRALTAVLCPSAPAAAGAGADEDQAAYQVGVFEGDDLGDLAAHRSELGLFKF